MAVKRMKSSEVRTDWRAVLAHVESGGSVVVEHYNRPIATITPYTEESKIIPQISHSDPSAGTTPDP
jgi:antitoxin (DNA-binding transcriptional repressor) of toxin-antitoxin stability system